MGRCPAAPRGAKSKTYVYELIAAASFEQEMKSVDQGVREIQRQIRRKKRKHFLHRHWPKFVTAIIGGAVFAASYFCSEAVQPLLVNIAAALISIPIVFLFYQMIDEKNHRNMIEYVYEYVDNHTFEIVDDAIDAVKVLLEGFSIFFDAGCADCGDDESATWVKMSKYGQIRANEDDEDFWPADYTQDDYDRDMFAACDEMDDEDIFQYDNATIIPKLMETAYIGYQVFALDLEPYCEELEELVKNPLVLSYLEEERLTILLSLNDALTMLTAAVHNKQALFGMDKREIKNFRCKLFGSFTNQAGYTGGCDLYYDDGEFSTLLDQDIIVNADKKKLTTIFRLIPERIPLLGAQINEFLMWAERWRNA